MDLRTTFHIDKSPCCISHADGVMFVGSCFASSVGSMMEKGKIPVMINPAGTVFNPASAATTLEHIISGKTFTFDDLNCHGDTWFSFSHYTDFSSDDPVVVLDKINRRNREASEFLKRTGFLFITFGTAWIYRLNNSGEIVSNCHKMPSGMFQRELMSVQQITDLWMKLLDTISYEYPSMKIIFTISPVRHFKDGAHGNQISKSILFLAVEALLGHRSAPFYFPAYEIMMDDLRDYRFYDDDMLHPSSAAVNYIWNLFSGCWLSPETSRIWEEASRITTGVKHRFNSGNKKGRLLFAGNMLSKIAGLENLIAGIDFSDEKKYFNTIIENQGLTDAV
jgi:hypothetical protein